MRKASRLISSRLFSRHGFFGGAFSRLFSLKFSRIVKSLEELKPLPAIGAFLCVMTRSPFFLFFLLMPMPIFLSCCRLAMLAEGQQEMNNGSKTNVRSLSTCFLGGKYNVGQLPRVALR